MGIASRPGKAGKLQNTLTARADRSAYVSLCILFLVMDTKNDKYGSDQSHPFTNKC